ncbi:Gfo/Idh/MocA family protein [Lysobacter tyrosinilyticus]
MSRCTRAQAIPVAIVGFGRMGRLHARTLQRLDEFCLIAVIDPDPDCAAVAAALGVRWYASVAEMVDVVELAVVAVPSTRHADIVGQLVRRGLHCMVEKPVGVDGHQVEAMAAAAAAAGVRVFAGFSERFNPVLRSIHTTATGAPATIRVCRFSSHALQRDFDTDVSLDLFSHDLDWLSRLLGADPEHLQVEESRLYQGRIEELHCRMFYPSGVQVELSASRIALQAERSVTWQDHAGATRLFCLDACQDEAGDDALTAQARALAGALRGERTGIADLDDARRVHRLLQRLSSGLQQSRNPQSMACNVA